MALMAKKQAKKDGSIFTLRHVVDTTPIAKRALDRLVADLRGNGLMFNHKLVTKEFVFSATWLWLEQLGIEAVESGLMQQIPRLEAVMKGGPLSEMGTGPGFVVEDVKPAVPKPKTKRG